MAKITDPDNLTLGIEIEIDPVARTIELVETGNLSTDGVTGICIYSFLKDLWVYDLSFVKYPFPITAITEVKFDLINGWDWLNDSTRNLIRDAGWRLFDGTNSLEEYFGFISLGNIAPTDQIYYQQEPDGYATDLVLLGPGNQAIKIFGDAGHGNFNYRSYFKCFAREYGRIYSQSDLDSLGLTSITYQAYSFALSTAIDVNIDITDGYVDSTLPYSGMSITYLDGYGFTAWANTTAYPAGYIVSDGGRWFISATSGISSGTSVANDIGVTWTAYSGERQVGDTYYAYNVIIDGYGGSNTEIYNFVQRSLRKSLDIDAGGSVVIGKVADELLSFVGETLVTSEGVFIDNSELIGINNLNLTDFTGTVQTYPFSAFGTISFNSFLTADSSALYSVFFSNTFGTVNGLVVEDLDGNPITGPISAPIVQFSFDYDGNTQGGRTPSTDTDITIVASGLESGQYISVTGVIRRTTENSYSVLSTQERSYTN